MSRPKGSKNKVRRPPQPRLQPDLLDRADRQARELARLQWWQQNRPPGY